MWRMWLRIAVVGGKWIDRAEKALAWRSGPLRRPGSHVRYNLAVVVVVVFVLRVRGYKVSFWCSCCCCLREVGREKVAI